MINRNEEKTNFLVEIQEMQLKGILDPSQILSHLIETYYQKRKKSKQGGLLRGFFQNESEAILRLCNKLINQKNISIFEKIKLINEHLANSSLPLENDFQNLLNAFFSHYKNDLLSYLAPSLQKRLQLSHTPFTPEMITQLLSQLDAKDENVQFVAANALAHIAKLLPEKQREIIARSFLKILSQFISTISRNREVKHQEPILSHFLEALADMGSAIPETLLPEVIQCLKNSASPGYGIDIVDSFLDKFTFIISNPVLRDELIIFFNKTLDPKPGYGEQTIVPSSGHMKLLTAFGQKFEFKKEFKFDESKDRFGKNNKIFNHIDFFPDQEQEKMFESFSKLIHDPQNISYYHGIGSLLRKFWKKVSNQNKKIIIDTLFETVNRRLHPRSSTDPDSVAQSLVELTDCIPEDTRNSFVETWVKRYVQTGHTYEQNTIIRHLLIPFAKHIPDHLTGQLVSALAGNIHCLNAHSNCVRLFIEIAPKLSSDQKKLLINEIMIFQARNTPEAASFYELESAILDIEVMAKLWNSIDSSELQLKMIERPSELQLKMIERLIEICCYKNSKLNKAASSALSQIAMLSNSDLIPLLENKIKDQTGKIRPGILSAMSQIIYQKESERLLSEKLGRHLAKLSLAKTQ